MVGVFARLAVVTSIVPPRAGAILLPFRFPASSTPYSFLASYTIAIAAFFWCALASQFSQSRSIQFFSILLYGLAAAGPV